MKYQPPFDPNYAGPVDGVYNADPDAEYRNGNPATGEEGSIPPMESVAHPMKELVHLIAHSGQTPSHEDLEQVRKAIKKMIEDGTEQAPLGADGVAIWNGLDPVTRNHVIRGLMPGANVTIDLVEEPAESGQYLVRISAGGGPGGGDIALANVGDGAQVFKGVEDDVAALRTIKGINGIGVAQAGNVINVDGSGFGPFLPFFPEVETSDNKLVVTALTGQVIVAADQSFIHRGVRRVLTSLTDVGARTFATSANKIYHLRWRWTAGAPAYVLLDLADSDYNPGAFAESHAVFDSKYDDMLIARVVTSAGNVPTVTALRNKHVLRSVTDNHGAVSGTVAADKLRTASETYNWARTPDILPAWKNLTVAPAGSVNGSGTFAAGDVHDHDDRIYIDALTRYAWTLNLRRDFAYQMDVRVLMIA